MRLTAYNDKGGKVATWTADRPLTVGQARREIIANGTLALPSDSPFIQGWVVDGVGIFTWHTSSGTLGNPMQFMCDHAHDACSDIDCVDCTGSTSHFETGCPVANSIIGTFLEEQAAKV